MLSPESQASLTDLASFVVRTRSGPNQTAAEGTFRSRQGHFIKFCDKHKITHPVMTKADQDNRNYVLACYASSLIHGETILARAIKTDTIKQYLYAAASFSLARQCLDPRLNFYGKESHHLSKILGAHKHWEAMPDRREPVTELMIQHMQKINPGDDTLDSALYDWNVLGKYYGYRRAEWAQDHKNLAKKKLARLPQTGEVQAFRRDDFIFYGADGTCIAQGDKVILDENDPNISRIDC
eukprot:scaffold117898_cov24-Attheya_sp.AAC.1